MKKNESPFATTTLTSPTTSSSTLQNVPYFLPFVIDETVTATIRSYVMDIGLQ